MLKFIVTFFLFIGQISLAYADEAFIHRQDVQNFIHDMVKTYHFKQADLVHLFATVKKRPEVLHQIRKPLEIEPWNTYQRLFVSEWRIEHGVKFWNKYAAVLKKAERIYGVPAGIIVATIGVETKYGERIGGFRVVESLSNIAFSHSPRANYFRKELTQFLLLAREQHLDPSRVMGSYAGAIGQPQFMPSSYRYYAVDFSGNGKIDLMNNTVDVIGSVANYYKKNGWKMNQPIATRAFILGKRYQFLTKNDKLTKNLYSNDLRHYGIVPRAKISRDNLPVKIITLSNRYDSETWIGFQNFDVIKRYNPSNLYAMSVFQLSSYITALRERLNND